MITNRSGGSPPRARGDSIVPRAGSAKRRAELPISIGPAGADSQRPIHPQYGVAA